MITVRIFLYFDWRAVGNTKGGASSVDWEYLRHTQEIPPFFIKVIGYSV